MIVADRLARTFRDGTVAVEEASFDVRPGEVLALLGPNGAGKTTTLHMILGLLRPSAGRALLGGIDVQEDPAGAYRLVGYLSENVLLYGNLTARENLRFFADVSGATVPASRLDALLDDVGLAHVADRRVHAYSKGMRQRLGLAIALVKDPPALVLDEPTTGLDPEGTETLLALIRGLRDEGRAILLSTHDLHRVQEVADRVAIMGGHRVRTILANDELAGADIGALYREHAGGAP
ncbi:MAG TPA: ABC transporter ATP-binding protein [Candidatus Thermoplasmatota archaeon]|nr:ABC transporter ATP-binding protein [Candidatus Thermoplasmatota archaeon]